MCVKCDDSKNSRKMNQDQICVRVSKECQMCVKCVSNVMTPKMVEKKEARSNPCQRVICEHTILNLTMNSDSATRINPKSKKLDHTNI